MGVIPPRSGFLEKLREITRKKGIILIFDEVITGFRLTYGGYQNLVDIKPDLTCLGKIIGGGLPVGAFGGRKEIMESLAPLGPVYQAGTLSGNPLAMAAGLATLKILREERVYEELERKASYLSREAGKLFEGAGILCRLNRVGSMFTLFFAGDDVVDFATASKCDTERFSCYFIGMREKGIYIAPSQFEASFVSLVHSDGDIEVTLEACKKTLDTL